MTIGLRPLAFFALLFFSGGLVCAQLVDYAIVLTLPANAPPIDPCTSQAIFETGYGQEPGDCDARRLRGYREESALGFCPSKCYEFCANWGGQCFYWTTTLNCTGCYNGKRDLKGTEDNENKVTIEQEADRNLKSICGEKDEILDKLKKGVHKTHKKDEITRVAVLAILDMARVQCVALFDEE